MARIGKIVLPTKTTTINGQSVTYADSTQLETILNKLAGIIDLLAGGYASATYTASNVPPTGTGKTITTNPTGATLGITWDVGDEIKNKTPTTVTANGHTYILLGWICTAGGNSGTAKPPTFQPFYGVVAPF
ncbi:hypothetical protein ACAX43_12400 [Paraburkholderia sp. IW21]|uniref:hypothetical protein n=1 Tax=Paraburkholderia sp. IW21 TaxID=3242488 RepID=UPI003520016F